MSLGVLPKYTIVLPGVSELANLTIKEFSKIQGTGLFKGVFATSLGISSHDLT
jgi:hypothetical protein